MSRILFILKSLPYPIDRDGLSVINYRLLKNCPDKYRLDIISMGRECTQAIDEIRKLSTQIDDIKVFENNETDSDIARQLRLLKNLMRLNTQPYDTYLKSNAYKYDLIYYCVPPSALFCKLPFGKKHRPPVFLNAVDSFALLNERFYKLSPTMKGWLKWMAYKTVEKKLFGKIDCVNFVSEVDAKYTYSLTSSDNISVIPNGVDAVIQDETVVRSQSTLLFVGNFNNISNRLSLDDFVARIWPRLKKQHHGLKLCVVGPHLNKTYSDPDVEVKGFVADVNDYYRRCTIFIAPLISGSGIKNKVLEAMSAGIPVVSSSIGLDGISVKDGVHVLRADTPVEWSDSITALITDKDKRNALAVNASLLMESTYSWPEAICRYYRQIAALIDAKNII